MEKHVLGLVLPTDPRWVNIAEKNIQDILIDHAYCEQKAASSCISLIIQYPEMDKVVETLTPIVAEEWGHFERVLEKLKSRDMAFGMPRKDEYVEQLQKVIKKGGSRVDQLVEKLLMNALIEARSCERFRLLWKEIDDADLSKFYYELMVSEAGHYKTFLALAKAYKNPDWVEQRWRELLAAEAVIVSQLEVRSDRMH
ncbi:MAG TPA: tRNA 2-methylthio-N6-isopentenyl adenosine(37) hydroxylase MiaE [Cytophagales bacterium]|nr:tRNA 2-methylthio-N6-isopentenyl adenosine(37) hydroxylase MiaE [Cytophagales bacterium]